MSSTGVKLGILLATLGFLAGCGPDESRTFDELACPIINGEPDSSPEHLAVVAVLCLVPGAEGLCTGTLVSRRVVMTAAHCVESASGEDVEVHFGDTQGSTPVIMSEEVSVHPRWSSSSLLNDIALVRLERNAPEYIKPIPNLPASKEITEDDIGTLLEYVGFGQDNVGSAGFKRSMKNDLEWICTQRGGCWREGNPGQQNTICIDSVPGATCFGDSGGPALIVRDDAEYVCGINSYVAGEDCSGYSCGTKVDVFEAFIEGFVGARDGTPCEAESDCASWYCIDGFCCDTPCADPCGRCDLAGLEGTCTPLADGTSCSDGDICNGDEICLDGTCQPGEPMACSDGVDCTRDECDAQAGCVFVPQALECFDDNECTRDICDPEQGCVHETLPDGTECGFRMTCKAGVCVEPGGASGCTHLPSGRASAWPWWMMGLSVLCLLRRRLSAS